MKGFILGGIGCFLLILLPITPLCISPQYRGEIQRGVPNRKVMELLKDLKDLDPKTRISAVEDLGHLAEVKLDDAKPAIPALLKSLKDRDAGVRRAVIAAMKKIEPEPKDYVPALTELLKKERDATVRLAAVRALGQIGPPAKSAVPTLKDLQREIQKAAKKAKPKDKDKDKDKPLETEIVAALNKIEEKK
jgi:HEAT repeat protein